MDACSAVQQGTGFVSSVTGYIDCQSEVLGSGAWQALSMPGSTLQIVLTGFLTIFIALIGYNLLLGGNLTVRSGTIAFVKIGAVFALATSWPAYRTIVYDLVTDGPGQLVSEIGPQAGVAGADGTLIQRLDLTDRAFVQLDILGPGNAPAADAPAIPPAPFGGFDSFALGGSRILFLLSAVGGLVVVRIVAGLMLALGPFFIAFLMFDNTRSLFEGWVRVLGGAALAAVGVSIALGLELAFLDTWLSGAIARRMAGEALPTVSTELFVICCLFAMIIAAVMFSCTRLVRAFRLAPTVPQMFTHSAEAGSELRLTKNNRSEASDHSPQPQRTRAAAVASVVQATSVREARDMFAPTAFGIVNARTVEVRQGASEGSRQSVPLGQSFSRRHGARISARAARRDA